MDFSSLARKRYSCRKYLDRPVERDKVDRCLEAARLAPSACNAQPWRFTVADRDPFREKIASAACSGIYRMSRFIKKAPVLIIAAADLKSFTSKAGSFVTDTQFYLLDMGIACEHIILQATEEELGTCYIGWFNHKKIKKLLGLPKKTTVPLIISMGYPSISHKEKDPIRKRAGSHKRKAASEIITYNPPLD